MADSKNFRRHGARYKARRRAVDIIYEAETRDLDPVAIVTERIELASNPRNEVAPIAEHSRVLVAGTAEKLDEIDETISRFLSENWELSRLPAVDRAILRVMAYEIMYVDEVDAPISVVDGVEIASGYSTDKAAPYIHAVLDDIAQLGDADNPLNVATTVDLEEETPIDEEPALPPTEEELSEESSS